MHIWSWSSSIFSLFFLCSAISVYFFPFGFTSTFSIWEFGNSRKTNSVCYAVTYFYCIVWSRLFEVLCVPSANELNVAFVHGRFCELWVVKSNFVRHGCLQYLFLKGTWRQRITLTYSKDLAGCPYFTAIFLPFCCMETVLLFEDSHLKGLVSVTLLLNKPHDVPKVLTTHLWGADKIRQSVCQVANYISVSAAQSNRNRISCYHSTPLWV